MSQSLIGAANIGAVKRGSPSVVRSITGFHRGVLWFLMFANVIDMGGGFLIKYLSYMAIAVGLFLQYPPNRVRVDELAIAFVLFVIAPALSIAIGASNGADLAIGLGQVTPFAPAMLLFLYLGPDLVQHAWRCWFIAMQWLALIIVALFATLLVVGDTGVGQSIINLLNNTGQGYFGARTIGIVTVPNVYFKATLFLVPAFAYALWTGRKTALALIVFALLLSFSKASFVFCGILLVAYWVRNLAVGRSTLGSLVLLLIAFFGLHFMSSDLLWGYLIQVVDALTGTSDTASVRVGHLKSLGDLFADNPIFLLLGQGVGTEFYSIGVKGMVTDIELDHLDAVRQFGAPWFLGFTFLFLLVVRALMSSVYNDSRAMGVALLSLFIVAGTNPVLINPLTLMMLVVAWKETERLGSARE